MISALKLRLQALGKDGSLENELQNYLAQKLSLLSRREGSDWQRRRKENERQMNDDYKDRVKGSPEKPTCIFDISNERTDTVSGAISFVTARLCKELFGTKPYVAVSPQGVLDQSIAQQMQQHFPYKLAEAQYESVMSQAIRLALEIDDCPIKTTYERREDRWMEMQTVLVDGAGNVVMSPPDADGLQRPITADLETTTLDAATLGTPVDGSETTERFAAFPEFVMSPDHRWEHKPVERVETIYNGLKFTVCNWEDVLYAETEYPLRNVFHKMNVPLADLYETYAPEDEDSGDADSEPSGGDMDLDDAEPQPLKHGSDDILTKLANLRSQNQEPQARDAQGNESKGEQTAQNPTACSHVDVVECYFEWHWFDGRRQQMTRVFALFHEKSKTVIYYDYLAAVCPRGTLPVHIIRALPQPGRAYGVGYRTLFKNPERLADYLWNCALLQCEQSAWPVRGVNKKNMKKSDRSVRFGFGAEFELDGDEKLEDMVQFLRVPTLPDQMMTMMNDAQAQIQTHAGYNDAAQANLTALPSGQTATGVNSMLEVSSVLVYHNLFWIKESAEPGLQYAAQLLYLRQDTDETYEFLEGQSKGLLALKDAQAVAKLPLNVTLSLLRSKQQSDREAAESAIQVLPGFYNFPPEVQLRLLPLYKQYASGAGLNNPEQFFPTSDELQQQVQASAMAAGLATGAQPQGPLPPDAPNVIPAPQSEAAIPQ